MIRPTLSIACFISVLALLLSGCAINSNLTIPAHETFVLGGNGNGRFNTKLSNTGNQPVIIAVESKDGTVTVLDTLAPGDDTRAKFPKGSAALLTNESVEERAVLKVHVTGSLNLGMAYESGQN